MSKEELTDFLRTLLSDQEQCVNLVVKMAKKQFPPEEFDNEYARAILVETAVSNVRDNFEYIYTHAASPIEKLFLIALQMFYGGRNPLRLVFTPPIDVEVFQRGIQANYVHAVKMWESYQQESNGGSIYDFRQELEQIPDINETDIATVLRYVVMYHLVGAYNQYHVTLQPVLNNIKVNGKGIRPDLYVWIPSDPNFKLIVECDGFQHHSSKKSFSSDRQRDRVLQTKGYRVFRFSGQEIYHDPASKAVELAEYLENASQK
jgi:hypothetical protein